MKNNLSDFEISYLTTNLLTEENTKDKEGLFEILDKIKELNLSDESKKTQMTKKMGKEESVKDIDYRLLDQRIKYRNKLRDKVVNPFIKGKKT